MESRLLTDSDVFVDVKHKFESQPHLLLASSLPTSSPTTVLRSKVFIGGTLVIGGSTLTLESFILNNGTVSTIAALGRFLPGVRRTDIVILETSQQRIMRIFPKALQGGFMYISDNIRWSLPSLLATQSINVKWGASYISERMKPPDLGWENSYKVLQKSLQDSIDIPGVTGGFIYELNKLTKSRFGISSVVVSFSPARLSVLRSAMPSSSQSSSNNDLEPYAIFLIALLAVICCGMGCLIFIYMYRRYDKHLWQSSNREDTLADISNTNEPELQHLYMEKGNAISPGLSPMRSKIEFNGKGSAPQLDASSSVLRSAPSPPKSVSFPSSLRQSSAAEEQTSPESPPLVLSPQLKEVIEVFVDDLTSGKYRSPANNRSSKSSSGVLSPKNLSTKQSSPELHHAVNVFVDDLVKGRYRRDEGNDNDDMSESAAESVLRKDSKRARSPAFSPLANANGSGSGSGLKPKHGRVAFPLGPRVYNPHYHEEVLTPRKSPL